MTLPTLSIFEPFYKKHKETLLYLFFGGLSFILSMLLYYIFSEIFAMNVLIANIVSWVIVVAFCFVTNKTYVFEDKSEKTIIAQLLSFYIGRLVTLGIEELILFVFITLLSFNNMIVKIIAQIIVIILNYIFSKLIVFKKGDTSS